MLASLLYGVLAQSSGKPADTVKLFLKALQQGNIAAASKCVQGAKRSPILEKEAGNFKRMPPYTVLNEVIEGNTASVKLKFAMWEAGAHQFMTAHLVKTGGEWLLTSPSSKTGELGFGFDRLVFMIQRPEEAGRPAREARANLCIANVKQVALAIMLCNADHEDKFFKGSLRGSVSAYLKRPEALNCPGTHQPYMFNRKLAGVALTSIVNPAQTIMIYEGTEGKLRFDHDGRTVIGFADGHVKMMSKDQAAKAIW